MKFSGDYEIALPVRIKGLDPEKLAEFLTMGADLIDEYVSIGNPIARDFITLSAVDQSKSSIEIIDLIEDGGRDDGYEIRVNAIIPVSVENLKCNGDKVQDMLNKVLEMVNMHTTCRDYTYRDILDIEEATGIMEVISYDIQHDEPALSGAELTN